MKRLRDSNVLDDGGTLGVYAVFLEEMKRKRFPSDQTKISFFSFHPKTLCIGIMPVIYYEQIVRNAQTFLKINKKGYAAAALLLMTFEMLEADFSNRLPSG